MQSDSAIGGKLVTCQRLLHRGAWGRQRRWRTEVRVLGSAIAVMLLSGNAQSFGRPTVSRAGLDTVSRHAPAGAGPSVGRISVALVQSTDSPASQDSVVMLVSAVSDTASVQCTGTLVAPTLVLTARHCVTETREESYACNVAGQGGPGGTVVADLDPGLVAVFAGRAYPGTLDAPSAYGRALFHDGAQNLCDHDIALLWLDRPLVGVSIATMRLDREPAIGDGLTAVGWGATELSSQPSVRQQQTNVRLSAMGPYSDPTTGVEVPPSAFAATSTICHGDSGGPTFDARTLAIVGIAAAALADSASSALTECPQGTGIYERLPAFKTTILSAFAQAAESPQLEVPSYAPPAASPPPCEGGPTCPSSQTHADVWNCSVPSGYSGRGLRSGALWLVAWAVLELRRGRRRPSPRPSPPVAPAHLGRRSRC